MFTGNMPPVSPTIGVAGAASATGVARTGAVASKGLATTASGVVPPMATASGGLRPLAGVTGKWSSVWSGQRAYLGQQYGRNRQHGWQHCRRHGKHGWRHGMGIIGNGAAAVVAQLRSLTVVAHGGSTPMVLTGIETGKKTGLIEVHAGGVTSSGQPGVMPEAIVSHGGSMAQVHMTSMAGENINGDVDVKAKIPYWYRCYTKGHTLKECVTQLFCNICESADHGKELSKSNDGKSSGVKIGAPTQIWD
ncbi:Os07g0404701 [Oryza sativa Japonica Group]|uniref:Os07g0404701 protein n=1 Tax=Oryza sativa subsp. japonica TaxID=39947 RepID=A0A0P0X4Q5_ORYSJ|nr:Os07g0404701 [Oryza sativa Japonica Group]